MANEYQLAKDLISNAMETANDQDMDKEVVLNALLSEALTVLLEEKKKSDVLSMVEFIIKNTDTKDYLITRGC